MPHDLAIDLGDRRGGQGVVGSQPFDDQMFCLVAIGVIRQCGYEDLSNDGVIVRCFGANDHSNALPVQADSARTGPGPLEDEGLTKPYALSRK